MLASINFDYKSSLHADEIDDVAADWGLPAELVAAKLSISQDTPQGTLGVGRITS